MQPDQRAETEERIRLFALIGQIGKIRNWKGEYTGIVMKHHTGTDRIDKLDAGQLRRFLSDIGADPDQPIEVEPEAKKEAPRRGYRNSNQRTMANHQ